MEVTLKVKLAPSGQTATSSAVRAGGAEMAALAPGANSATPANATSTDGEAVGNLIDL